MPHFVEGTITEVLDQRSGLQKVRLSRDDGGVGDRAYVLTQLIGTVAVGDRVVLNTTAVELGLGTGGWHFVHWNLAHHEFCEPGPGHIMKLRYTSLQIDTGAAEETLEPNFDLQGTPVVLCTLLSQAAVALLAYKSAMPHSKVALVVADQAALPLVLSDLVHELRQRTLVDVTITAGQAFGGDLEAVNTASALGLAKAQGVDTIFVTEGIGVVGAASKFGFSGFEMAAVANAATEMGGWVIVAIRYSEADPRTRHQGVSHHTDTLLDHCNSATIAQPRGEPDPLVNNSGIAFVDVPDVAVMLDGFGIPITTMGRNVEDDPGFYKYAAAAGLAAAHIYDEP